MYPKLQLRLIWIYIWPCPSQNTLRDIFGGDCSEVAIGEIWLYGISDAKENSALASPTIPNGVAYAQFSLAVKTVEAYKF